jgi:hypothetical protein
LIALVFGLLLTLTAPTQSQANPKANQDKSNSAKPAHMQTGAVPGSAQPASQDAAAATPPDPGRLAIEGAALQDVEPQGGDYVPCEFTIKELLRLRAAPEASTLTGADSEALKLMIIAVAQNQEAGGNPFTVARTELFIKKLASENFTGKTQSQSLETVMSDYSTISTPLAGSAEADAKKAAFQNAYLSDLKGKGVQTTSGLYTQLANINFALPLADLAKDVQTKAAGDPATNTVSADILAASEQGSKQQNTVVDATRQATSVFLQPNDVACAMQILTYKEAQYAYGTIVAKNYVVIQVNVRNLNPKQEFQIHDAEFAVDVDPSGRHGRFFSGSDKRVVRSFSVAQQSFDSRNLAVNISAAGGSLLSSMVPIFKGSFADAVGVLTGGAIPGLGKVWKDRTTDQLNLLNDTALTPGTNGTSVPKDGVAQFMMFVPSRVFESGWWTLPCANETYLASKQGDDYLHSNRESGQTGLDVDRLIEPCLVAGKQVDGAPAGDMSYSVKRVTEASSKDTVDIFHDQKPLPFKKWSGSMLSIFRELSFTTVAGAHTVEASQLAPEVSKWSACTPPFDKNGNVVFDGTNPIVCVAGGQNLGAVKSLRLRNADNQSDSLDSPFAPTSGAPSTGAVKFDAPKLAALAGTTYTVLMTDNSDKETKTNLALHLIGAVNPVAAKINTGVDAIDFASSPLPNITIFGSHLDGISKVILSAKDNAKVTDTLSLAKHDAFSLPLDLSGATNIKGAATKAGTGITITLQPSDPAAKPIATALVFQVKNSNAAH